MLPPLPSFIWTPARLYSTSGASNSHANISIYISVYIYIKNLSFKTLSFVFERESLKKIIHIFSFNLYEISYEGNKYTIKYFNFVLFLSKNNHIIIYN